MSTDFPTKVLNRHAYVVLSANSEIVPTLERGSILFDRPYFPGLHAQAVLHTETGEMRTAYITQWLFKVRDCHTQRDLELGRDQALARDTDGRQHDEHPQ